MGLRQTWLAVYRAGRAEGIAVLIYPVGGIRLVSKRLGWLLSLSKSVNSLDPPLWRRETHSVCSSFGRLTALGVEGMLVSSAHQSLLTASAAGCRRRLSCMILMMGKVPLMLERMSAASLRVVDSDDLQKAYYQHTDHYIARQTV